MNCFGTSKLSNSRLETVESHFEQATSRRDRICTKKNTLMCLHVKSYDLRHYCMARIIRWHLDDYLMLILHSVIVAATILFLVTSGFCCGAETALAGQGAGRLSGLQRGLTSMWSRLSRVNVAFLNAPFASALRARRGGFTSLQTKSVHFKLCLAGIVKQGRITYSWFRD